MACLAPPVLLNVRLIHGDRKAKRYCHGGPPTSPRPRADFNGPRPIGTPIGGMGDATVLLEVLMDLPVLVGVFEAGHAEVLCQGHQATRSETIVDVHEQIGSCHDASGHPPIGAPEGARHAERVRFET